MNQDMIKRRKFIKGLAALTLAPTIIPKSVLGMGSNTAASDRITLGIIGAGKKGTNLIRTFLQIPEVQIVAVSDVDANKLHRGKQMVETYYSEKTRTSHYSGCDAYDDFREIIYRRDIDAIVNVTPDHWHAAIAIMAAKNGKDIYSEKPLTLTIGEGPPMIEAVRKYNRVFQTGSQQRSSFEFRFACELVRNEYIGELQRININLPTGWALHPFYCDLPAETVPDVLNWDMWLGPAPERPFHHILAPPVTDNRWPRWREYRDYSGGMMTDWGAHHFDIAQWALDMDQSGPVQIIPPNAEANTSLTYIYANGIPMTMQCDENIHNMVEFYGTKGKIEVTRNYLKVTPSSLLQKVIKSNDIHLYKSLHHQQNWIDCIRSGRKPICDVETGHRSVSVCHLGNLAVRLNRSLDWDPQKERFVNDDEANRHLSKPYRSPWVV